MLWLAASGGAAWSAPLAGSVLENTARATYFDTDRGFNATLQSNTVSVTVQALEALTLTSDNTLQRSASGIATLPHRLTNTGNVSSQYVLRFANRSDDDHDLLGLRLVWDRNGNGVADTGEPQIASGTSFGPLEVGEFADFVLVGSLADGVAVGRVAQIDLSARSVVQGVSAANIDSVTVANGALLQLVASVSNPAPRALETVTLNLTASNTGNRAASGLPVSVDGVTLALVLLRDVIPANTTLAALGLGGGALALYHLLGQPEHSYTRTAPTDLRLVDAVAFGFTTDIAPGQSLMRSLDVQINRNAAGPVTHVGRLLFMDGVQPQPVGVDSNPVRMLVPDQPPSLRLFGDAQYTRPITVLTAGQPFYVAFNASRCNLDPLRAETQQITVSSTLAGDIESFVASESGTNTGEFRIEPQVPTVDALRTTLARGDARLSVRPNDVLMVSVSGCGAVQMQASVLVDPFGVVFDSKTSAPLAGALVTLIDVTGAGNGGRPGRQARVFLADGLTPAPSVLSTGPDGSYQFPLVAPSVYRLQVVPPAPYTFPSTLATSLLPPERVVEAAGSYGGTFTITALSEPVHLDIPLDADPRAGFFIEKTASRKTVELGEFVDYQIKIKNVSGQLLGRIRVTDLLPAGFAYLRGSARLDSGSARLDGSALPEPEGGVGPALVFNLGSIDDAAVRVLSYRVRVGPGAMQGDGTNRAQATSAGPLPKLSNQSRATVQVLPGVFGDRGFLVGNVYADCNNNRERDDGEPGIAGVRLFLEDGTHVTTDRLGRYSLYGLKPRTHVLKLDRTSLPFSVGPQGAAQLVLLSNRNAGDAGSRFVDMKNGELQRADFALAPCSDAVRLAIAARAQTVARADQNLETVRDARLAADPRLPPVTDPKALPASGVVGGGNMPPAAIATPTAPALSEAALATPSNRPATLSSTNPLELGSAQTTVAAKGEPLAEPRPRISSFELPARPTDGLRNLGTQALPMTDPKAPPASERVGASKPPRPARTTPDGALLRGNKTGAAQNPTQAPALVPALALAPTPAPELTPAPASASAASPAPAPASLPAPAPASAASATRWATTSAAPALSDEALATLDNSPAILSPTSAQVLGFAQTTVTVKGALGAELKLRVNGVELPATRIGRLRSLESQALQVAEYVGVDLKPGLNTLEVVQADSAKTANAPGADGAPRAPAAGGAKAGRHSITVTAPGALAKLRLSAPIEALSADGRTLVRLTIEPLDAAGVSVTAPTPVTLNASRGRWQLRDLDPDEPGVQVFVEGGALVAELESPSEPGDVLVQAASGKARAQIKLGFSAELRPLIAAGVIEGVLNLSRLGRGAIQPARAQDGFEQALQNVAGRFSSGFAGLGADAGARAALFLKGKVLGDTLLTLAYDSEKSTRERLFRDIQPGEFYPVYGDESVPGFDGQSTGRLYVRLDRGRSYVLYGDFNTQTEARLATGTTPLDERRLGQYSRSLNGARAHLESDDGRRSLTAFAAQTSSRQVIDELPALGTSGPYRLSRAPFVENSEKVELLTRDRSQVSLVLRSVPLARFVDYEIDTLSGGILLKAPLPSLDAGFNPNSLRVTFEVDQGGAKSWVGGAAVRIDVDEQVVFSAGVVRDNDPQQPLNLQSVGVSVRPAPGVSMAAEVARTQTPVVTPAGIETRGKAARVELRVDAGPLQVQAQAVIASAGFGNASAAVTRGRQENTAKASYKAGDSTTLKTEVMLSEDLASSARRSGGQVSVEQALNNTVRGELAVRHSRGGDLNAVGNAPPIASATNPAANPATATTTVLAKLTAQLPDVPNASVFAEAEQDVEDPNRRLAAIGGEYRLNSSTRLYGRYEFISSLGSRYGLNEAQQRNATVFGVQTEYLADANLFSEYRLRDALGGRQAEAAIGLRNRWKLGGGWSLATGYERVRSLNGNTTNVGSAEATSITGSIEYTGASDWKGAARLELRDSSTSDSVLSTVGVAFKLDDEWTALGRNLLTFTRQQNAASKTEDWLQFGIAYREGGRGVGTGLAQEGGPREGGANRRNALLRAEYRTEDVADPSTGNSGRRVAIISAHINEQLNTRLALSGRVAAKWARDQSVGLFSRYHTKLLAARATYDIAPRWDAGIQASALIGAGDRARQVGLGVEGGTLLGENLWLSLGWNVFGFTDRDLTAQDYTQRGVYLRLRFKFDEALF